MQLAHSHICSDSDSDVSDAATNQQQRPTSQVQQSLTTATRRKAASRTRTRMVSWRSRSTKDNGEATCQRLTEVKAEEE